LEKDMGYVACDGEYENGGQNPSKRGGKKFLEKKIVEKGLKVL
jgi:hypothetical protein